MAEVDLSENNGGALVVTAILFLVLSWISVALRTYVRAILTKGFQADDWLMLVAQAIFTLSCSFILTGVSDGIGRHNVALPQDREIPALMWQALATATYVINMMFIKLSIGIFLLRISVHKVYTYILYVSMGIIFIWSMVIFIWDIFQCSPVQAQWDYRIPNSKCVTPDAVVQAAYSISVMTILSDWLYALLPIPMIWKVKMTTQAKLTVIAILSLGVFASVATLIRLKFLADLTDLADILFVGTDAMVWTLVEPGVAIIAASLVTIRPLLRLMRLKGFSSTGRTTGPSAAGKSGTNRSGTNRSGVNGSGRMPGYGRDDLRLVDLETGKAGNYENITSPPNTALGSPRHRTQFSPPLSKQDGAHLSLDFRGPRTNSQWVRTTQSEIFVIEGREQRDDVWQGDKLESPSLSSVDMELGGRVAESQSATRI